MLRAVSLLVLWILSGSCTAQLFQLDWSELPSIPDELGVAGPVVGHHADRLVVAGGANFPRPVWETDKQWHDAIYVLSTQEASYRWEAAGRLPRKLGYPACVSTDAGVLVMGGNDADQVFDDVFMMRWKGDQFELVNFPALPKPCVHGSAAVIGGSVYLVGGQSGDKLESAMDQCWRMELRDDPKESQWEELAPLPGKRALHITLAQHNGYEVCLYVISGRTQNGDRVEFLKDVWEYSPSKDQWRQRSNVPACVMAGSGAAFGNNHLFVFGGDNGEFFTQADDLKDDHPGFPKKAYAYHTVTDRWLEAGAIPANHVTTQAVHFDGRIVIPSGEVRPRVRSPKVWSVQVKPTKSTFGVVNYVVLFGYLAAMVGVGVYFARKNKNTDDYFRGGRHIPWWAAGCSIYATMLSSLTYTGIPSLSFQQDWVIAVLNFTIPIVAFIAIGVALPFFRRIDATSAYEYLERRFNYSVRLFGSLSFTLFHIFRMAIVLALTGLALDVATPLSPKESVLLMGVLSIIYCTVGGIEAVIWTDTIQTVVLLGGALVAGVFLLGGVDGGISGYIAAGQAEDKFNWAHFNFDLESAQVAIWFIIIGGIAQNISSYTADQAVVQRYMTTETERLAARSIWTNAVLAIPTTLLFFGIGTGLYAFYQSNPDRLDPTITPDQVFPLFIAHELPVGIAGLIVAGIFAAAQSTVSTSMNSMATTTVTDLLRPLGVFRTEAAYLRSAQVITLAFGIAGTAVALVFIDPNILRRFEAFIKVVGLFMGVLGGLFVLGAMTRKANGPGTLFGAFIGAGVMIFIWKFTDVTSYMYTFFGIASCAVSGYLASLAFPSAEKDLTGLTIYTLDDASSS